MNKWDLISSIALGLLVNEFCDVSPWLAARLVTTAARLWSADLEQSAVYAEEWTAIIEERPGKLFKLGTALSFLAGGTLRAVPRWLGRTRARPGKHASGRFGTPIKMFGRSVRVLGWTLAFVGFSARLVVSLGAGEDLPALSDALAITGFCAQLAWCRLHYRRVGALLLSLLLGWLFPALTPLLLIPVGINWSRRRAKHRQTQPFRQKTSTTDPGRDHQPAQDEPAATPSP